MDILQSSRVIDLANGAPYYEMDGRCGNCRSEYRVKVPRGQPRPAFEKPTECPRCGCVAVIC